MRLRHGLMLLVTAALPITLAELFIVPATLTSCREAEREEQEPPEPEEDAGEEEDGGRVNCPPPIGERFPAGEDFWSPRVIVRNTPDAADPDDPNGLFYVAPIHLVLLPDGRVLLPGEKLRDTADAGDNITTRNFVMTVNEPTADMEIRPSPLESKHKLPEENLFCAGHAPLADGRIFFAGGTIPESYSPPSGEPPYDIETGLAYAQIFDPATNAFTMVTPDMLGGKRWYPTVTRLPDGRMLVSSGQVRAEVEDNLSVELFDPAAFGGGGNPWTMLSDRAESPKGIALVENYTHVYALPKPFDVAGHKRQALVMGENGDMFLFNTDVPFAAPNPQRWHQVTSRPGPEGDNRAQGASALMLPLLPGNKGRFTPGSVLVVGGAEDVYDKADVYDPGVDVWCPIRTGTTGIGRYQHATVNLPDGNVLVVAGHSNQGRAKGDPRMPQIINPTSGHIWTGRPWPENRVRGYHSAALLLPDGRVLVGGGLTHKPDPEDNDGKWDEDPSFRYYSPPYLGPVRKGAPRPAIDSLPGDPKMRFAQRYAVRYSNGPIEHAALIAIGATTHSFDENQRYIQLDFEGGKDPSGEVTLFGPESASWAPPGHYLLFLGRKIDGWTVPSIAKIIKVE
jgi:galactose oxidase